MASDIQQIVEVTPDEPRRHNRFWRRLTRHRLGTGALLVFVLIGFHGGFLQAGVGVTLLVGLVLGAGFSLVEANGVKMMIAFCFSGVALVLFGSKGMVHWPFGLLMAVGQALGAWIAARYLSSKPSAAIWVRRLLLVVILLGIGRFLILPTYEWIIAS